jgi:hypothetical protein
MQPDTSRFIEIAKRSAIVGMHAAQAYNTEQAKLQLELVLSPQRLASEEGTRLSLASLEQLTALTRAHRAAFEHVVLSSASELAGALAELPANLQEEYRTGLVRTVNWHLAAQGNFYKNRERWIVAARELCELIDGRRDTATFRDDGAVTFADDTDFERFESLMEVIEEVHQSEVEDMKERLERLAKSASVLGLRISP